MNRSTCQTHCSCGVICRHCRETPQTAGGSPQYSLKSSMVCREACCLTNKNAKTEALVSCLPSSHTFMHERKSYYGYGLRCESTGLFMASSKPPSAPCPTCITGGKCSLWNSCSPCVSPSCPYMALPRQRVPMTSGKWPQSSAPYWDSNESYSKKFCSPSRVTTNQHRANDKGPHHTPALDAQSVQPKRVENFNPDKGSAVGLSKQPTSTPPCHSPSSRNSTAVVECRCCAHPNTPYTTVAERSRPGTHSEAQTPNSMIDLDEFWRRYMTGIFQARERTNVAKSRGCNCTALTAFARRSKPYNRFPARRYARNKNPKGVEQTSTDLSNDAFQRASNLTAFPPAEKEQPTNQKSFQGQRNSDDVFQAEKPIQRKLSKNYITSWHEGYALDYSSMPKLVGVLPPGFATMHAALKQ